MRPSKYILLFVFSFTSFLSSLFRKYISHSNNFHSFTSRSTAEQQQQTSHQAVHKPKSVQLPFCINDSLALAHKHYNQKKIKQIRFLFKHRENCLLQRNQLVKKFQSQPNIYRNWNCEECGL